MAKRSSTAARTPRHDPWDAITLSLVHANSYPCKPAWRIPLDTLTYTGVALCTHGHGWCEVDGRRFDIEPDSLVMLLPGYRFASGHDPQRPITLLSVGAHLSMPGASNPLAQLDPPLKFSLTKTQAAETRSLFEEVIRRFQNPSVTNALAARGAFLALIAYSLALAQTLPAGSLVRREKAAPLADTRVALACALIDAQLNEPLALADLASAAHLTPPHFSLLFRNATGFAPMDYLRRRRIDRAKALLAHPQNKVETVSRDVGFTDPYHFSRVFRKIVGVPPRVYAQSKRRPSFP